MNSIVRSISIFISMNFVCILSRFNWKYLFFRLPYFLLFFLARASLALSARFSAGCAVILQFPLYRIAFYNSLYTTPYPRFIVSFLIHMYLFRNVLLFFGYFCHSVKQNYSSFSVRNTLPDILLCVFSTLAGRNLSNKNSSDYADQEIIT